MEQAPEHRIYVEPTPSVPLRFRSSSRTRWYGKKAKIRGCGVYDTNKIYAFLEANIFVRDFMAIQSADNGSTVLKSKTVRSILDNGHRGFDLWFFVNRTRYDYLGGTRVVDTDDSENIVDDLDDERCASILEVIHRYDVLGMDRPALIEETSPRRYHCLILGRKGEWPIEKRVERAKYLGADVQAAADPAPRMRVPGSLNTEHGYVIHNWWLNPNLSEYMCQLALEEVESIGQTINEAFPDHMTDPEINGRLLFSKYSPLNCIHYANQVLDEMGIEKPLSIARAIKTSKVESLPKKARSGPPESIFPKEYDCRHKTTTDVGRSDVGRQAGQKDGVAEYHRKRYGEAVFQAIKDIKIQRLAGDKHRSVDWRAVANYIAEHLSGLQRDQERINQEFFAKSVGSNARTISLVLKALVAAKILAAQHRGRYQARLRCRVYGAGLRLLLAVERSKAPLALANGHWIDDKAAAMMLQDIRSGYARGWAEDFTLAFCLERQGDREHDKMRSEREILQTIERYFGHQRRRGIYPEGGRQGDRFSKADNHGAE